MNEEENVICVKKVQKDPGILEKISGPTKTFWSEKEALGNRRRFAIF